MARCLVVGGNGFLGSYLVDELVSLGHEVTVFDRFSAGTVNFVSAGVHSLTGDYLNNDDLRRALIGQELVFHFLSTTTPATAENDPSLDVRTNVAQSVELFGLAVEAGISRLYFASTGGAMYGNSEAERLDESVLPAPLSPYAIGKQSIEGYLRYFRRKHGLESVSFRISNPYGPRQHTNKKQGVIPIFLQRVAHGEPLEVYGDGSAVRDYVFAADAARMMARVVGQPHDHEVYNIGRGEGHSLAEVVDLVRKVTRRPVEVCHSPQPKTFLDRVVLDIGRYEREFGSIPFLTLQEGIALTWHDTAGPEADA